MFGKPPKPQPAKPKPMPTLLEHYQRQLELAKAYKEGRRKSLR